MDYYHRARSFKQTDTALNRTENLENVTKLYRMATELATKESLDSSYFNEIIDLLIVFLKLHQPNDTVREQVIDLVTVFRRVIQVKEMIFHRFERLVLMVRTFDPISNDTINRMEAQFACLQRFMSCINLNVVAKRLASSKVVYKIVTFYLFISFTIVSIYRPRKDNE